MQNRVVTSLILPMAACVAGLWSCAEVHAATRIALVSNEGSTKVDDVLDAATAELSKDAGLDLLDRREVSRMFREQQLSLAGLVGAEHAVKAGHCSVRCAGRAFIEHDGTNRTTTAIPYQEAPAVIEARGWVTIFIKRTFPLPELDSDTVRYFTSISHIHHVIPQGHGEVSRIQVGAAYLHKFVYSAGRVKNVYGVNTKGTQTHTWSVVFDEANHVAIRGSFHEGKLSEVWLVVFPADGKLDDPKQPIQQWLRFLPSGEFRERQIYSEGRLVRSERAPIPGPLDSGKYPCQALRYYLALDGVVSEAALAPDEKVARVLPFLSYEAEPDEGKSFGTDSYSGLHQKAVAVLGNIDSEAAFRSLVDLVKGEALRSHAAEALAKHRSRDALPHLLTALEAEDLAEPRRNRQQISARIVSAMFEHSPSKAAPLVRQFLDAKQRRYASAIEGAFGRAQEKSQ